MDGGVYSIIGYECSFYFYLYFYQAKQFVLWYSKTFLTIFLLCERRQPFFLSWKKRHGCLAAYQHRQLTTAGTEIAGRQPLFSMGDLFLAANVAQHRDLAP